MMLCRQRRRLPKWRQQPQAVHHHALWVAGCITKAFQRLHDQVQGTLYDAVMSRCACSRLFCHVCTSCGAVGMHVAIGMRVTIAVGMRVTMHVTIGMRMTMLCCNSTN